MTPEVENQDHHQDRGKRSNTVGRQPLGPPVVVGRRDPHTGHGPDPQAAQRGADDRSQVAHESSTEGSNHEEGESVRSGPVNEQDANQAGHNRSDDPVETGQQLR